MRRPHVMTGNLWLERAGLSSRKLSALDQYSSELANFDEGGAYTLQEKLIIGGAGMTLGSTSEIAGGVTTKPKYGASDPKIELFNQWPVFAAPRTRSVNVSWLRSFGAGAQPVYFRPNGACYQTGFSADSGVNIGVVLDGPEIHDGATLDKITFSYRYVGARPAAIPGGGVGGVIVARYLRATDSLDTSMHSAGTSGGVVYSGSLASPDVIGNVVAWWNDGNMINLEYVPDQNNVINKSTHYYAFGIQTSAPTEAFGLKFEYTVSDQRFE